MDQLSAIAAIEVNGSKQERTIVGNLTKITGVGQIESKPDGQSFMITAKAECNPPFKCGATVFESNGVARNCIRRCVDCKRA